MADAAEGWDEEGLRERCHRLREALLVRAHASEEELLQYWPDGELNSESDPLGRWIYTYGQLCRLLDRLSPDPGPARSADADRAILAALREEPEVVELPWPLTTGRGHLSVYPKSLHALLHMAARDQIIGRLALGLEYLRDKNDGDVASLIRPLTAELSYQHRCQVWAACHPGPGLPFADDSLYPEPPAWTLELEAVSVLQLMRAHNVVNGQRLALLRTMLQTRAGSTDGAPRLSWATIAVLGAQELGTAGGTRALLREHALESWLAQLTVRAETKAQARAEAASGKG